jgi:hypothetical protein
MVSLMGACWFWWWEKRDGYMVERGSGSIHLSNQKKVDCPLLIVQWVVALSVFKCLKMFLPRNELFRPWLIGKGDRLVIHSFQGV